MRNFKSCGMKRYGREYVGRTPGTQNSDKRGTPISQREDVEVELPSETVRLKNMRAAAAKRAKRIRRRNKRNK